MNRCLLFASLIGKTTRGPRPSQWSFGCVSEGLVQNARDATVRRRRIPFSLTISHLPENWPWPRGAAWPTALSRRRCFRSDFRRELIRWTTTYGAKLSNHSTFTHSPNAEESPHLQAAIDGNRKTSCKIFQDEGDSRWHLHGDWRHGPFWSRHWRSCASPDLRRRRGAVAADCRRCHLRRGRRHDARRRGGAATTPTGLRRRTARAPGLRLAGALRPLGL